MSRRNGTCSKYVYTSCGAARTGPRLITAAAAFSTGAAAAARPRPPNLTIVKKGAFLYNVERFSTCSCIWVRSAGGMSRIGQTAAALRTPPPPTPRGD